MVSRPRCRGAILVPVEALGQKLNDPRRRGKDRSVSEVTASCPI
jgi:hypothetical protein